MYEILQYTHSALRYLLLALLIFTTLRSLTAWITGGHYYNSDERAAFSTVLFTHIQLVLGLVLYFTSEKVRFGGMGEVMKNDVLRFFTVEHITMMLLAVILITIGRSRAKKAYSELDKHRRIAIFFLIALLLIFFAIPWPFLRDFSTGWI